MITPSFEICKRQNILGYSLKQMEKVEEYEAESLVDDGSIKP